MVGRATTFFKIGNQDCTLGKIKIQDASYRAELRYSFITLTVMEIFSTYNFAFSEI